MSQPTSIEEALAAIISASASPAVQEAQALLLRRLALEGDVIPSRIPAPRNITEVGGYLNLLAEEKSALRMSALASALGLASPLDAAPWDDTTPTPGFGQVANDLSRFGNLPSLPLTAAMREDFATGWRTGVKPQLAAISAAIPLWAAPPSLPLATDPIPLNVLPVIGREVFVLTAAALSDPDNDAIILGRTVADPEGTLRIFVRAAGSGGQPLVDTIAVVWDATANVAITRALGPKPVVPIENLMGPSGFHSNPIPPPPANRFDLGWGRLTNISGLVPGVSTLGGELQAVWTRREIARSCFADHLTRKWDGITFV